MGLAAAMPPTSMPPVQVYFMITIILSLLGWTTWRASMRGRFLALKTEDFVIAARLDGTQRDAHHLPAHGALVRSHIIASVTLAIPVMILAETALSFLGIGLQAAGDLWGVLLQEAQNIRTVAQAPWLLAPRRGGDRHGARAQLPRRRPARRRRPLRK